MIVLKKIGLVILTFYLYGCVSSKPAPSVQHDFAMRFTPPPNMALIYVARPSQFYLSGVFMDFTFNDRRMGKIGNNNFVMLKVKPGQHTIVVGAIGSDNGKFYDSGKITLDVLPGRKYFFPQPPRAPGMIMFMESYSSCQIRTELS